MRRSIASAAAALALAFVASHASADTVKLTGYTFGSPEVLSVGSPSFTGYAGEFSGTLNGKSFMTFCTDLYQSFNFNTTYTDYSVVSGVTAWGAKKSMDLDRAFSGFASGAFSLHDAASSAAAQAIVWEIIYETGSSYSLKTGSFSATGYDSVTRNDLNLANTFLSSLSNQAITVHANKLFSPNEQDFVLLTAPVPEPSTYALMFGGLVGMGFLARRRSAQR